MKLSSFSSFVCAGLLCLIVSGCAQPKPEGPGERIGKGIDEIAGAVRDIDRDQNQNVDRYQQERARSGECSGSEYYRNPRCRRDFSYDDDPYGTDTDSFNNDTASETDTRPRY